MYLTHLEAKRHKSNTLWGNHMCLPLCSSLEPPILSWQKPVVGKLFQKLSRNLSIFFLLFFFICSSLLTPNLLFIISVVQFTCSGMFESLWPHGLQHARPPCPSPTPGVYSNSRPLSRWCHPTNSSSIVPFSCPQSFPGSFQMSQLFASGGQSIGVSASTSVLPINIQDWFPLGWTSWISLQSKGLSRVFSNTTVQKHQFSGAQLSSQSNSHIHTWPLEKP